MFYVDVLDADGCWTTLAQRYKTQRGAIARACVEAGAQYGYEAVSQFEGDPRYPRHVLAHMRDSKRVLRARVWR